MLRLLSLLTIAVLIPAAAHAGWTSGGGELIRDAKNPWFLSNVKEVRYCIEIDEANFGQTRTVAADLTRRAIENWKLEFNDALPSSSINWGIASQTFRETACDESTDIRFQFGTLTGDQIKQLEDPTHFAGISVRTDYDRVQMRGKGFVYISPARGPLKFNSAGIVEEPWSLNNGGLLYHVLLHELGHVFGFSHNSTPGTLMDERAVEISLSQDFASGDASYWGQFPQPSIFRYRTNNFGVLTMCTSTSLPSKPVKPHAGSPSANKFFGIPDNLKCLGAGLLNGKYVVNIKRETDDDMVVWGEATVTKSEGAFDSNPVMYIWMPPEQKVFVLQQFNGSLVPGPTRQNLTVFKGTFVSKDKKVIRDMAIFESPEVRERVSGVMDGKLLTDVWGF